MIVELHVLQNFAPSNLNRDDTNSPKECQFGGYRRARISSQCIKRAVRQETGFQKLMEANRGVRTKQLIPEIVKRLTEEGVKAEKLSKLVADVFKEGGISSKNDERTDTIFFINRASIDKMVDLFEQKMPELAKGTKESKAEIIGNLAEILVDSVRVPDIALFGRMLAIEPDKPLGKKNLNIDAACQVAHAISTHKVGVEFDFYTAVDDLQPKEESGASMMGDIEFNSACYYRYANIDLSQLKENLGGDGELARKTVEAFIRASVAAVPTGKQTSFAAQNPPDFVFAVVRDAGTWSLANAFSRPVREGGDLIGDSITALVGYWNRLNEFYRDGGIKAKPAIALNGHDLKGMDKAANLDELVSKVSQAIAEP